MNEKVGQNEEEEEESDERDKPWLVGGGEARSDGAWEGQTFWVSSFSSKKEDRRELRLKDQSDGGRKGGDGVRLLI